MATTSHPIPELAVGMRDTSGAVVASGHARFYQPGTLTPDSVFSDPACASAITQPVTLNAAGQATVYTLNPVRMILKDSTDSTTYYDDIVNLHRADTEYVTIAGFNGGAETTVKAILATANSSFGAGFQDKPTSTATARNLSTVLAERRVSVKSFGAAGDGVTNDAAAIQAAIDYVGGTLLGGVVFFPAGTYLINTGLSNTVVGVSFQGESRVLATIKNGSTSNTALTINVGAADSQAFIRDLAFTASTTSSGTAVLVSGGNRIEISNVATSLHRTGIDANSPTSPRVEHCYVLSTDNNAAAIGIRVGVRGRVIDCEVISSTNNGTGVVLNGQDASAVESYAEKFATGVSCAAVNAVAARCTVFGAALGVSLAATATAFDSGRVTSCTTGISVGAVAAARVAGTTFASNTTDLSVNSSATNFYEQSNWATLSAGAATNYVLPIRASALYTTSAGPVTWAVVHAAGVYQTYKITAGGSTIALSAPSGSNKMVGDMLYLAIFNPTASNTLSFNAIYTKADGSTALTNVVVNINNSDILMDFMWDGGKYRLMRFAWNSTAASPNS